MDTGRPNDLQEKVFSEADKPVPGPSGVRRKSDDPKGSRQTAEGKRKRPRFESSSEDEEEEEEVDNKENVVPESKEASRALALPLVKIEPQAIISSQAQLPLVKIEPQAAQGTSSEFSSLMALVQNQQIIAAQKEKVSGDLVAKVLEIYGSKK